MVSQSIKISPNNSPNPRQPWVGLGMSGISDFFQRGLLVIIGMSLKKSKECTLPESNRLPLENDGFQSKVEL